VAADFIAMPANRLPPPAPPAPPPIDIEGAGRVAAATAAGTGAAAGAGATEDAGVGAGGSGFLPPPKSALNICDRRENKVELGLGEGGDEDSDGRRELLRQQKILRHGKK
jgi:hypothetical protein